MTVRTKDGQEITLSYQDLVEGKITVTGEDGRETNIGSGDLTRIPSWVPMPPDLKNGTSVYHSEAKGNVTGQFSGKSDQSPTDLQAFYEGKASALGLLSSSTSSLNTAGTAVSTLRFSGKEKSFSVVITEKTGSDVLILTEYSADK